jgi:hypothetical protein
LDCISLGRLVEIMTKVLNLQEVCNDILGPTKRISVLLPTRGRAELSFKSLSTLWATAKNNTGIEYLVALDEDDEASIEYYEQTVIPYLEAEDIDYQIHVVPRWGYERLHEYVNYLGTKASGEFMMFWNDDAIMDTKGWDKEIDKFQGQFRVLRMPDQSEHPYSIFPIIPHKWKSLLGTLSRQQMSDAWVSQIAYLCNIMVNIPVKVTHDRFDLTGNNNDETYNNRPQLEGNPSDPRDLNSPEMTAMRYQDCAKIMWYLKEINDYNDHFQNVISAEKPGDYNAWKYLEANDPNAQTSRFEPGTNIRKEA